MSRTGQSTFRTCLVLNILKKSKHPMSANAINDALIENHGVDVCYSTTWHDMRHMVESGLVERKRPNALSRDWIFDLSKDWK